MNSNTSPFSGFRSSNNVIQTQTNTKNAEARQNSINSNPSPFSNFDYNNNKVSNISKNNS